MAPLQTVCAPACVAGMALACFLAERFQGAPDEDVRSASRHF